MTRLVMALILVAAAAKPATYKVDDDYVAVRVDILAGLNAADKNLPVCEKGLEKAQDDLQALRAEADQLRAAAVELRAQKAALEAHIGVLETALGRGPSVSSEIAQSLESMDEELACAMCWGLGTLQCVGLAYIFNQNGFRR